MSRTLTTEEVADRYATNPDMIRRWIRQGRLKAINIATPGRPTYRISADELDRFDEANSTQTAPAA